MQEIISLNPSDDEVVEALGKEARPAEQEAYRRGYQSEWYKGALMFGCAVLADLAVAEFFHLWRIEEDCWKEFPARPHRKFVNSFGNLERESATMSPTVRAPVLDPTGILDDLCGFGNFPTRMHGKIHRNIHEYGWIK